MGVTLFEQMATPKENRYEYRENFRTWGLFILLAVAAAFRFFDLGLKPPHFDEGINGHFVITIWRDGFYSYDPTNFHGPLYFYFCHLAEVLMGRGVESFRVVNAFISVALVGAVFQLRRFLGRTAIVAAWILAVSPAFTFYGRYAIHETLFILGQVLFVYGRFTWMGRPSRRALVAMVTGIVVLVATKETFFIFLGTWFIAELGIWFLERLEKNRHPWSAWGELTLQERRDIRVDAAAMAFLGLLVLVALYTGFFERTQGLTDFVHAFDFWSKTGTKGNGHEKPFGYWLELMTRYEWPMLVGLVAAVYATICLRFEGRKQRILLLMGFGHWLAYSLVPYKTPWLILNFWPLAFFFVSVPGRVRHVLRGVVIVLLGVSCYLSYQLNFKNFADSKEPYVYVQTTNDYKSVMSVLRKTLARNPEIRNGSIVVMIQDPWPLPYELSLFPKMRYARIEDIANEPSIVRNASLMLIDASILDGLRRVMPKRFGRMKFQLRDAYGSGWALFDYDQFRSELPAGVDVEEPKP